MAYFFLSASEAIKRIVQCISCHDSNNELQHFEVLEIENIQFENNKAQLSLILVIAYIFLHVFSSTSTL